MTTDERGELIINNIDELRRLAFCYSDETDKERDLRCALQDALVLARITRNALGEALKYTTLSNEKVSRMRKLVFP